VECEYDPPFQKVSYKTVDLVYAWIMSVTHSRHN